jgi:phenylpropionate dioxygenase-like ring-hydroxylating dioxygenase large terminal subunit
MKFIKLFFFLFSFIQSFENIKDCSIKNKLYIKNNLLMNSKESEEKYNLNWYVIGEKNNFKNNKLYKIKIMNHDYLVWKNNSNYFAMDNYCSHRGASLALGKIVNNNIICPYHGYQFNNQGKLCKIPGLNFINSNVHNQNNYEVVEKNGWVYLNTINKLFYNCSVINVFEEPESFNNNFRSIFINTKFNTYGRLVSENSLDVMHIGFVHTFGNSKNPSPLYEKGPYLVGDYPYHYKSEYTYEAGEDSMARKLFGIEKLVIENEFILPHTTIARVIFGNMTSTVITSTLPYNETTSHLFVKTYRNFWNNNNNSLFGIIINYFGDLLTTNMMKSTVLQDKAVIENINLEYMDGKFNMKYDKLQNVYRALYKKLVKNITFSS